MLVVLCYIEFENRVLLLKRNNQPYAGYYALVGGKVEEGEDSLAAARREVREETGLEAVSIESIIKCSEVVLSDPEEEVLFKYDMELVRVKVRSSMMASSSSEGELLWMDGESFIKSNSVVPTDIDMVGRYISGDSTESLHYIVLCDAENKYSIKDICVKTG